LAVDAVAHDHALQVLDVRGVFTHPDPFEHSLDFRSRINARSAAHLVSLFKTFGAAPARAARRNDRFEGA
jgi:hypothetical protein